MWVWDVALFLLFAVSLTLGCEDSSLTCSAHNLMFTYVHIGYFFEVPEVHVTNEGSGDEGIQ